LNGPVAPGERLAALDVLRGLALFGMVVTHVHKLLAAEPDHAVGRFILRFVAENDRAMFALLFGAGLALMLQRLEARGTGATAIVLRRLAVLYVIGFAVESLTRFAILREFAWWGLPLVWLRRLPTRTLLLLAAFSVAAFPLRTAADTLFAIATQGPARAWAAEREQQAELSARRHEIAAAGAGTDYAAAVRARAVGQLRELPSAATFTPNALLALFILGLLAVRHGVLANPWAHRSLIAKVMLFGALSWAFAAWVLPQAAVDPEAPLVLQHLRTGWGFLDLQFLGFTYAGGALLLLARKPAWVGKLGFLGWPGRLALTVYLLHAAAIDYAGAQYGLGLRLGPAAEVAIALLLFGALAGLSGLWLQRFRFGPVEWLWRSLTYGERQAWRAG
jgi:uncharacterized protein